MNNLYAEFLSLIPKPALYVGKVLSSGAGSSVVELADGSGVVTVRGTGTANSMVYVRDSAIEGPAPTLPQYVITV